MGFLNFFLGEKKSSASVAKERLQLILAHERNGRSSSPDYLPQLQRELVAVISKYVSINPDDIKVHMERQGDLEVLEVKIELPDTVRLGAVKRSSGVLNPLKRRALGILKDCLYAFGCRHYTNRLG